MRKHEYPFKKESAFDEGKVRKRSHDSLFIQVPYSKSPLFQNIFKARELHSSFKSLPGQTKIEGPCRQRLALFWLSLLKLFAFCLLSLKLQGDENSQTCYRVRLYFLK